jgi:CDP-paratose 2-epimerase
MRGYFFGEESSTSNQSEKLQEKFKNFIFHNLDIRNYSDIEKIFSEYSNDIEMVIHTAAQPSHDWAKKEPLVDFTINANGTLNLLELSRVYCPNTTFIFTSTNKVYGDNPNKLNLIELENRYEFFEKNTLSKGIDESMSIDNTTHSLFGVSKTSADLLCQEYGKYFNMNVGIFRAGCITGIEHQGSELHGFLSYFFKKFKFNEPYNIFGYKGKQVRDNIHPYDLSNAFWLFHQNPKKGEVYNIGGGRNNSISILELINEIDNLELRTPIEYNIIEDNRKGDHIWYITNSEKFEKEYPEWKISFDLKKIINLYLNKL